MKPEHQKYILDHCSSKSLKEIARHLNLKEKKVRKFVEHQQGKKELQEECVQKSSSYSKKSWIICMVVIILSGLIVYGNSLNGQFIWDDERLIENNPTIKDWKNIGTIFTSTLRTPLAEATSAFRPLQTFSYMFDYSIGRLNVIGYHLTSTIFHILCAVALFWFIQLLFRDLLLSFLTALIFLVHPVHTEAVAYISGRADPMAAFFMMLSFCIYLKNEQKFTTSGYFLMCLSYLCALLSRENVLIFPILIMFYHYAFKRPLNKKIFAGILCTALVYLVWRAMVFQGLIVEQSTPTTFWQRMPGIFVAFVQYIKLLLLPMGLHMEYGGLLFHWNEPKVYAGMVTFCVMAYFLIQKRKQPVLLFSLGWFLITLLPVMNIIPLNSYMAEHWLYIPSMGFALLAAYFLTTLYRRDKFRILATVLCIGSVLTFGSLTINQNRYWSNPIHFYKRTLEYNPNSTRLYTNLAGELLKADQEADLIGMLKAAIKIDPENAVAYNNLGNAYKGIGEIDNALSSYRKSIALNPNYAGPYYNLGVIYNDVLHEPHNAIPYLRQAISRDETMSMAYHKLGRVYLDKGDNEMAITLLRKAITVNPDDSNLYHSLAFIYFQTDNTKEAINYYKKTIEFNPQHGEAYKNLAIIYYNNEQYRLAIQYCDKAVEFGHAEKTLLDALKPFR